MTRYAENTAVSSEKSRAEIERVLQRYGAGSFMYGWSGSNAMVGFEANGRRIQFNLDLPDKTAKEFTHTPSRGTKRTETQALESWEQACRQRWRALALCIKAKLEAVECGITTFEEEFLAHIVLPNGQRVSEHVLPAVAQAYQTGRMIPMLPGPSS